MKSSQVFYPPKLKSGLLATVALSAAAITAAVFAGLLLATENYLVIGLLSALVIGPALLSWPRAGLWAAILGATIAAGLVDLYIPALQPVKWGIALLAIALGLIAVFGELFKAKAKTPVEPTNFLALSAVFFLYVIFCELSNWNGASELVTGLKGYFQVWGLFIAAYTFVDTEDRAKRLMTFILWLGVVQLPFVLHQFVVLIPLRSSEIDAAKGIVAGDIVAGTFGGSMHGGGRSSTLAVLLAVCITFTLACLRGKRLSPRAALGLCGLYLLPMLMSEAKLFLVLLPAGLFFLYRDQLLKKPLQAALGVAGVLALLTLVFSAYTLIPGAKSQQRDTDSAWDDNVAYNFGDRGYGNARLNRSTVYPFWLNEHVRQQDWTGAFIGHGLGSTNGETVFVNNSLAASKYRGYGIGITGLSTLLWETGLVGTALVLSLLISAYRLGGRLSKRWADTTHWPALKTAQISIVLIGVNFLHNSYFSFDLSFQTLFAVVIGYLLAMTRISPPAQTHTVANAH